MGGGLAPRFAVEVAFLGLLALAVGLAELATPWIVAVMAVGWLLVTLVEWLAWRAELEELAADGPTSRLDVPEQPTDSWEIEDILAPLPADEAEAAGERPAGEEPRRQEEA